MTTNSRESDLERHLIASHGETVEDLSEFVAEFSQRHPELSRAECLSALHLFQHDSFDVDFDHAYEPLA